MSYLGLRVFSFRGKGLPFFCSSALRIDLQRPKPYLEAHDMELVSTDNWVSKPTCTWDNLHEAS